MTGTIGLRPKTPPPAEPACIGSDPRLFDLPECFPDALTRCDECPVQLWCLETVDPANTYYEGVAGGLIWQNGRIIDRGTNPTPAQLTYIMRQGDLTVGTNYRHMRQDPKDIDHLAIAHFVDGHLNWRKLTATERKHAAVIMRDRGDSYSDIMEATRLSGKVLKTILT